MTQSTLKYFAHDSAIVETKDGAIGEGTRIWAFTHVLPGAVIGKDCNICDHVFIENDVVIGDRVTIKPGVKVSNGTRFSSDFLVGSTATI